MPHPLSIVYRKCPSLEKQHRYSCSKIDKNCSCKLCFLLENNKEQVSNILKKNLCLVKQALTEDKKLLCTLQMMKSNNSGHMHIFLVVFYNGNTFSCWRFDSSQTQLISNSKALSFASSCSL